MWHVISCASGVSVTVNKSNPSLCCCDTMCVYGNYGRMEISLYLIHKHNNCRLRWAGSINDHSNIMRLIQDDIDSSTVYSIHTFVGILYWSDESEVNIYHTREICMRLVNLRPFAEAFRGLCELIIRSHCAQPLTTQFIYSWWLMWLSIIYRCTLPLL